MTTGERIRDRRKELGLSADQVADTLGVNRTTIFRYERGDIEKVPMKLLEPIAKVLHTTVDYLMGWSDNPSSASQDIELVGVRSVQKKSIPMLGTVMCGMPQFADETHDTYIDTAMPFDADFCLTAKGDSMINIGIKDGTIVFVRKQNYVDNGEVAVVLIGDEATLKRVFYYRDKNLLILRAENSSFQDLVYVGEELEQVAIIGKAVFYQNIIA